MSKVKVSKELKKELDRISESWKGGLITLLKDKLDGVVYASITNQIFNSLTTDDVYEICKNGYELPLTKEEKEFISYFNDAKQGETNCEYDKGYVRGMLRTAKIYGIKIEGIN